MSKAVFRLVKPKTVTVVARPQPPGGGEAARIALTMRYLSMSERKALTQRLLDERVADSTLAHELVTGWSGVVDETGEAGRVLGRCARRGIGYPLRARRHPRCPHRELFGRGLKKNSETPAGDGRAGEEGIAVWEEAADVIDAWALVSRCWRHVGAGLGPLALAIDWSSAAALLGLAGVETQGEAGQELLSGLLAMEAGALDEFSTQRRAP